MASSSLPTVSWNNGCMRSLETLEHRVLARVSLARPPDSRLVKCDEDISRKNFHKLERFASSHCCPAASASLPPQPCSSCHHYITIRHRPSLPFHHCPGGEAGMTYRPVTPSMVRLSDFLQLLAPAPDGVSAGTPKTREAFLSAFEPVVNHALAVRLRCPQDRPAGFGVRVAENTRPADMKSVDVVEISIPRSATTGSDQGCWASQPLLQTGQ